MIIMGRMGICFLRRWRPHDEERHAAYYYASRSHRPFWISCKCHLISATAMDTYMWLTLLSVPCQLSLVSAKTSTVAMFIMFRAMYVRDQHLKCSSHWAYSSDCRRNIIKMYHPVFLISTGSTKIVKKRPQMTSCQSVQLLDIQCYLWEENYTPYHAVEFAHGG